jgi:hypothetical protein
MAISNKKRQWLWFFGLYAAGLLAVFLLAGLIKIIFVFI